MLRLAPGDLASIRRHGEETYPQECCGFLIGTGQNGGREVLRVLPARNEHADSPRNRYLVSPEAYLKAEREADAAGLLVVGFYHSHPDAEARPSEFDREHAFPGCSYAILAVPAGSAGELRSWTLSEDRKVFLEEELVVADPLPAPGRTP
jgi:proteasome lid subunit RPN8/RPN11